MKFKRKKNPNVKKEVKQEVKKRFKRKKTFTRKYCPKCYVCGGVLQDLIDLKWHRDKDMVYSDNFVRLRKRAQEKIVRLPAGADGKTSYRHNRDSCEPGGKHYMKDVNRKEAYLKHLGLKEDYDE